MNRLIVLLAIVVSGFFFMVVLTHYDLHVMIYLSEHPARRFVEFMSESIFELEKPGGGDIVVVYAVVCLLLYLGSSLIDSDCAGNRLLSSLHNRLTARIGVSDWLRRNRLRLEFLVVSTYCSSILMVKTLKWIMARPRPKKIFWGARPFYEWYELGPYFLDEGTYRASFPSGHTASAITLIAVAYVLIYTFRQPRLKFWGLLVFVGAISFTAAMAVARVMTDAHWPTDVAFSLFGGWFLIHVLFFYGLGVADQYNDGCGYVGEICPPPPFRAIRLCWYLTLFCGAVVCVCIGLKHFLHDRLPWLIYISVGALVPLIYSLKKLGEESLFRRRE